MQEFESEREVDLREYFRVLRRRKWWVVLTTVVLAVAAVGFSLLQTPVYSSTAKVLIPHDTANQAVDPQGNTPAQNAQFLERLVQNEIAFAKSDRVKEAAQQQLGFDPDVSVGSVEDTDVLTVAVKNTDKSKAVNAANVYANAYLAQRRQARAEDYVKQVKVLQQQILALQQQLDGLPPGSVEARATNAQIATLVQSSQTLQATSQLAQAGGQIVDNADTPGEPVSPKPVRNGLLGLVIGFILGIGLAFLVDRLDDSVKSKHDLEAATGLATIGLIPQVSDWRNRSEPKVVSIEKPQSVPAEAYRTLRTSLQILGLEHPLGVLAFTSAKSAEGKSVTVANLGVALARAGQSVVVVGCDFRRPRIHAFFGGTNEVGFTSVLLGDVSLPDALQTVEGQPRLRLLASGPPPPNPSELLSLQKTRAIVDWLRGDADFVLVDVPPVLPVPDALQLSQMVDGTAVIALARRSNKRELARTVELLQQVDAPLIGTVLNGVLHGGGYDYGYGNYDYAYDAGSYTLEKPPSPEPSSNGEGAASEESDRRRFRRRAREAVDDQTRAADTAPAQRETTPGE